MLYSGKEEIKEAGYKTRINNDLPIVTCTTGQKVMFVLMCVFSLSIYFFVGYIAKNNKLNRMQIKINESSSGIDVQLQKRFDTLTKLVQAVKSQAKFDKETLEAITAYRSGQNPNASLTEKNNTIEKISNGIHLAFEAYPTLGADESVRKLMNESSMIEKEIAASRRLYNADVTAFNSLIYTFPTNVVVAKKNYAGVLLFAANQASKEDVKLEF
ncbi:MAG: LemA family protein [Metamycoplasmataceae bacterium]